MKSKNIAGYVIGLAVIVVLVFGIVTIGKGLIGGNKKTGGSGSSNAEAKATTEGAADNSVPLTGLAVTAPEPTIRVGSEMQLEIKTEPADATNTKLKWTIDGDSKGIDVTEDGVLTLDEAYAKSDVRLVATATDGSDQTAEVDLRVYPAIDPSKPMVAVTFDDGPNPDTTSIMLDALEENYGKATFFCLGQNAEYYPETVKREYELGMEVGTHTYSHQVLTNLSQSALDTEVSKSVEAIKSATGVAPTLMRPPYGSVNKTVLATVKSYGLSCINWSLDTEDWKTKNADATYKMVMTATDGDVVLLHDIHEYNVDAVKRFVPDLIAEGFQMVTVSEMYEARGETLDPGTLHFRTDPTTESAEETTAAADTDSSVKSTDSAKDSTSSEESSTTSVEDESVTENTSDTESDGTAD